MQIPQPSRVRLSEYHSLRQQPLEKPVQMGLPFYGRTVDVEGMTDPVRGESVRYMGKATHVFDDVYWCLAVVGGALCVVEVTIRPHDQVPPSPAERVD